MSYYQHFSVDTIDLEVPEEDWLRLTVVPKKRTIFSVDSYFREGWEQVKRCWQNSTFRILHRLGLILFKPEAIVGRRVIPAVRSLASQGFVPVAFMRFRFDWRAMRALWCYQWNLVTVDRIHIATRMNSLNDSLLVIFQDKASPMTLPGAVRLSEIKGPSEPHLRKPRHLRAVMRSPNQLLIQVHSADEPIDVVRDVSVLAEREQLPLLLEQIRQQFGCDQTQALVTCVRAMHADYSQHDLHPRRSLERLLTRLHEQASRYAWAHGPSLEAIDSLTLARNGESLSWQRLERLLDASGVDVDWDSVVAASTLIHATFAKATAIIGERGLAEWLNGEGVLLSSPPDFVTHVDRD